MRALVGLVAALMVAGCARLPEHIAESYVSDAYYQRLSCPELTTARINVQKEARLASSEQARFVGVVFPASEYEQNTRKIAELKGTLAAIDRAQRMNACRRPVAPGADEVEAPPTVGAGPDGEAGQADGHSAAASNGVDARLWRGGGLAS